MAHFFILKYILKYGLAGLLLTSFLGATIFLPFTPELAFPPLLIAGVSPYMIVLISALGSVGGAAVNYALGYWGSNEIEKRVEKWEIERVKKYADRYGTLGLFFIMMFPVPLPVDPITVFFGMTHMRFDFFCVTVFLGKVVKYAMLVGLVEGIVRVL